MQDDLLALTLRGADGDDKLVGSNFDDTIFGGNGSDTFSGNAGFDQFFDSSTADSGDIDQLVERQDVDMTLTGNYFVAGRILGDDGGTFHKGNRAEDITKPAENPDFPVPFLNPLQDRGDHYAATYDDPARGRKSLRAG